MYIQKDIDAYFILIKHAQIPYMEHIIDLRWLAFIFLFQHCYLSENRL